MFDIGDYLRQRKDLVDRHLLSFMPECNGHASKLYEAMRYTLQAGGKRVRPICLLAGADFVLGLEPSEIMEGVWAGERFPQLADALLRGACAVEMIHTYSLIHDDLPCMDDDELRRGLPTCHKVYGEAMAVLAGDALQAQAFLVLSQINSPSRDRALDAIGELADGAGSEGMVAGQVVDLLSERSGGDVRQLEYIHRCKTAALFRACLTMGGIFAGGGEHDLEVLRTVGESIGLIFQVVDDILDVEGTTEELGKSAGKDAEQGKLTYPGLVGVDVARDRVAGLHAETREILRACGSRSDPLLALIALIVDRRS